MSYNPGNTTIWSEWSTWSPCDLGCQSKRQRYCHVRNRTMCPEANQHFIQLDSRTCGLQCVGKMVVIIFKCFWPVARAKRTAKHNNFLTHRRKNKFYLEETGIISTAVQKWRG